MRMSNALELLMPEICNNLHPSPSETNELCCGDTSMKQSTMNNECGKLLLLYKSVVDDIMTIFVQEYRMRSACGNKIENVCDDDDVQNVECLTKNLENLLEPRESVCQRVGKRVIDTCSPRPSQKFTPTKI